MKKLVSEVLKLSSGSLCPYLSCVGPGDELDQAATETLLLLVSELDGELIEQLEALVSAAERGVYQPQNPDLPDWGINDKNIWLRSPMALPGGMCVSNENVADYSTEHGQPQQFSWRQFHQAIESWKALLQLIQQRGLANLAGHRVESQFG